MRGSACCFDQQNSSHPCQRTILPRSVQMMLGFWRSPAMSALIEVKIDALALSAIGDGP